MWSRGAIKTACLILFLAFAGILSAQQPLTSIHTFAPVTAYTTAQTVTLMWNTGNPTMFTDFSACNDDAAGGDSVWFDASGSAATVAIESPPPATIALAGAGAGNVNAGVHSCKVTFVMGAYQSYGSVASGNVTTTAGDGQVSITGIPLGRTGVTARNIYCTAAGGSTYKLVSANTVNDNTTTTYTYNTADAGLGATLATNIGYTSVEIKPQECVSFSYPKTGTVSVITFANTAVVRIRGSR